MFSVYTCLQVWDISNNSQLDTFNTYTYRYYICLKLGWIWKHKMTAYPILIFMQSLIKFQSVVQEIQMKRAKRDLHTFIRTPIHTYLHTDKPIVIESDVSWLKTVFFVMYFWLATWKKTCDMWFVFFVMYFWLATWKKTCDMWFGPGSSNTINFHM